MRYDSFGSYDPMCAVHFIEEFEGFSEKPYYCSAGKKTIGIGHVILPGEGLEILSLPEARELLAKDIKKHVDAVAPYINAEVTRNMYVALTSFVFNLGPSSLIKSTLLKLLNKGQYEDASEEFPKWCHANGKVVRGLLRRRNAERALFLRGMDD